MDRFEEAKLRVKDGTDLVTLIEGYVPLRPRGRSLVGLCPFHPEKTPSFTVYPDTQHFKCYGCSKAGDAFTFLMEREGLSFVEAFEWLAEKANVSLEGVFSGKRSGVGGNEARDAAKVLALVRDWFRQMLETSQGSGARAYLAGRGLEESAGTFKLGFSPPSGALRAFAKSHDLPRKVLEQAGVVRSSGAEPFASRLMFPIEDERGRVVGFGGRVLDGVTPPRPDGSAPPKYLNSPESPYFNKRRVLYGLRHVKEAGTRRLVVVEGYTDVMACHQAGFTGAVATLGTALTADHAKLLERYASDGLVLLFDGDTAGRRAAERAFAELLESRIEVRMALADEGLDPADMVIARPGSDANVAAAGRVEFQTLLDEARDALAVWFKLLRARLDFSQPVHFQKAAAECSRLLRVVEDPVRQTALLQAMARHLGIAPSVLARSAKVRAVDPIESMSSGSNASSGRGKASGKSSFGQKKRGAGSGKKSDFRKRPDGKWEKVGSKTRAPLEIPEGFVRRLESQPAKQAKSAGGESTADVPAMNHGQTRGIDPNDVLAAGEADAAGEIPVEDLAAFGFAPDQSGRVPGPASGSSGGSPAAASGENSAAPRHESVSATPAPRRHVPQRGRAGALARADVDRLVAVLASPALREADRAMACTHPAIDALLGFVDEGLAMGRSASEAMIRFLFSRVADQPELHQMLGAVVERAQGLADPDAFHRDLMAGKRTLEAKDEARQLRADLREALASGDRDRADRLTREYAEFLRKP